MSAFFLNGEKKKRPGVYKQIINIGKDGITVKTVPSGGEDPEAPAVTVNYDESTNAVTISGAGIIVSHDGENTVALIIPGVKVSHDGIETVTIGG